MFISFFHKILTSFFCFSDRGFCSNPENNPVRAIHKCNLGLCGHFVRCAQSRLRVLLWGHSFLVGASLCSWSLSHLVPPFLSCPNPRSQLPFESSWSSATTAPPNPSFICAVWPGGIVRVVDVFGLKKEKRRKRNCIWWRPQTGASSQYANHCWLFLWGISYWQVQLNFSAVSLEIGARNEGHSSFLTGGMCSRWAGEFSEWERAAGRVVYQFGNAQFHEVWKETF